MWLLTCPCSVSRSVITGFLAPLDCSISLLGGSVAGLPSRPFSGSATGQGFTGLSWRGAMLGGAGHLRTVLRVGRLRQGCALCVSVRRVPPELACCALPPGRGSVPRVLHPEASPVIKSYSPELIVHPASVRGRATGHPWTGNSGCAQGWCGCVWAGGGQALGMASSVAHGHGAVGKGR